LDCLTGYCKSTTREQTGVCTPLNEDPFTDEEIQQLKLTANVDQITQGLQFNRRANQYMFMSEIPGLPSLTRDVYAKITNSNLDLDTKMTQVNTKIDENKNFCTNIGLKFHALAVPPFTGASILDITGEAKGGGGIGPTYNYLYGKDSCSPNKDLFVISNSGNTIQAPHFQGNDFTVSFYYCCDKMPLVVTPFIRN